MTTAQASPVSSGSVKNFLLLILFIFICQAVGIASSVVTMPEIPTWYAGLVQPALRPPNWIFAPVWTSLYALMGMSAYMIWQQRQANPKMAKLGLSLFVVQLLLNGLWSFIFFSWHNLPAASIEIVLLDLAVLACIIAFANISRFASILLWPYMAWISFATYLTISFWVLNP